MSRDAHDGRRTMTIRGIGVLAGSAVAVIIGVVLLARITVPDVPDFQEALATASTNAEGKLDVMPTALGGQLSIAGSTDGTMVLDGVASGPSFGLDGPDGNIFFESNPLEVAQMAYAGLAFFPDPGDCVFTPGQHNAEAGLVAVELICDELTDIRDNGSISISGYIALPADLVLELDLPETGGTVTVGDVTFEPENPVFVIDTGSAVVSRNGAQLTDPESGLSVSLGYDVETHAVTVTEIRYDPAEDPLRIQPTACATSVTELAVINPLASIVEVTFACGSVDVPSIGSVGVEGKVVMEQIELE